MEKDDQAQTDLTKRKQAMTSQDSASISLPVPVDGSDELTKKSFDNPHSLAHKSPEFMVAIYGLLSEVGGQNSQSQSKMSLMQQAMERKNVTIEEAIEGFWGAHSDPYVKDGDIQWRHIWKHVEKLRENRPQYEQLEPYTD